MPAGMAAAWLTTAQLGVFDAINQPSLADVERGKPNACDDDKNGTFTWVHRVADGSQRVDAILFALCGQTDTREGTTTVSLVQLLGYDEAGRLVVVADDAGASLFRWRDGAGAPLVVSGRGVQSKGQVLDIEAVDEVAKR